MARYVPERALLKSLVGFYGGSFNPFHRGHLNLIEYLLRETPINKLILVPSFSPPHKQARKMVSFVHRFEMARRGTGHLLSEKRLLLSKVEASLPSPSYTYRTLKEIQTQMGFQKLGIVLGDDMYQNIDSWYESESLKREFYFIVMSRGQMKASSALKRSVHILNPLWRYDSTSIRDQIKKYSQSGNESLLAKLKQQLPEKTFDYILERKLYF